MNEPTSLVQRALWWGWPIAALLIVTALPLTAMGAERIVLGEYFNALW